MAQLPEPLRRPDETGRVAVLVRTDAAGATHQFAAHLAATGVQFSLGANLGHFDIHTALTQLPPAAWPPAYQAHKPRAGQTGPRIELRDGAWVAELTGCVDLSAWPAGTRLILRTQRPHPGAQLRITDHDGMRVTGFLTNTAPGGPGRQLADLELRHRRHARVGEPTERVRTPGCATSPFHDAAQNRIWLAIAAQVATYEPKRLRLRILAVAGRIVRTARRRILKIDPAWPWAEVITTAHARLMALPAP